MTGAPSALSDAGSAAGVFDRLTTQAMITNRHVLIAGSLLLLLPNVLFAVQLQWLPAVLLLLGAVGMIVLLQAPRAAVPDGILTRPMNLLRMGACLILALSLLVLGGEGHLVFTNWDWLTRDAVLADLVREPFPPTYQVAGEMFFLRAPLGMYMLPALVAKATSLGLGHAALLVQNALLLTLVLYMLATVAGRRAALTIVVFLSFSGLDVIGQIVMWLRQGHTLASFTLPSHIENWSLQYSSVITQLFWVPNHALPSYWMALVVVLCARGEAMLGELGLVMTASLFWSPFAVIGTLPLAAYFFVRDVRTVLTAPRFWLAATTAICFLPVALYMQVDAAQVPHAFVLFAPLMASTIVLFLLVEIPHVGIVREVWGDLTLSLRGVLAVSIGFLIVLPTVRVGVADDLVMRASIPSLTVLSIAFAEALWIGWKCRRPLLLTVALAMMIVGAVTPAQELIRALTFSPFAISDCNFVTAWRKAAPQLPTFENYFARISRLPVWLLAMPRGPALVDQPRVVCWPDAPYDPRSDINQLSNSEIRRQAAAPHNPI